MATFVGEAHDTGGDPSPAVPAGTQDGDVIIAAVWCGASDSVNAPAGWTQIGTKATADALAAAMYYRVASSEPGSYTWDISNSVNPRGVGHFTFRGVDSSGGDPIAAFEKASDPTPGTTVTAPEVVTSDVNTIVTFNASYRVNDDIVLHSSADAGVEDADWGEATTFDFTFSGAVYHKLDVDPGTRGGYHIDLSGNSHAATCTFTVALEGAGIDAELVAPAPGATFSASGQIVVPGGDLAIAAPAAAVENTGTANLVHGDLAAVSPMAVVTMLTDSSINGPVDITAPSAQPHITGVHDVLAAIEASAPAPRLLMGAETRIFGARVVVVRDETRVRYPF